MHSGDGTFNDQPEMNYKDKLDQKMNFVIHSKIRDKTKAC